MKKKYIIILLLAASIAVIFANKFFDKGVIIEMDILSENPVDYQFFYASSEEMFSEEKSIHISGKKKNECEHIEAFIKADSVSDIRIDFGTRENKFKIKSLKINSDSKHLQNLFTKQSLNQVEITGMKDEEVNFKSTSIDPFLVIHGVKAKKQYDYMYIMSVFLLSILILYPACFMGEKIIVTREKKIEAVFLLVALSMCIVPVVNINNSEKDVNENRMLAKNPKLLQDGAINKDYGRQIEDWLNDRFNGRNTYIKIYDKLYSCLMGNDYDGKRAFSGKDNWLFYKDDHSIDLYQHRMPFSDSELSKIKVKLEKQTKWFKKHGIVYAILLAPNKSDVYGEYYREGVHQKNELDRIQLLEVYLGGADVHVTYPLERLMSHKKDGLLYWKTDTHWNSLGAYWGYREWMDQLKPYVNDIEPISLDEMDMHKNKHVKGDLAVMLKIKDFNAWDGDVYYDLIKKNGWDYDAKIEEIQGDGLTPNIIHTINPGKPHKVVVFRDSFSTSLLPYIASTFGEVWFMWNRDYDKYTDLILNEHVDIVLNEIVSRGADQLLKEANRWEEVD